MEKTGIQRHIYINYALTISQVWDCVKLLWDTLSFKTRVLDLLLLKAVNGPRCCIIYCAESAAGSATWLLVVAMIAARPMRVQDRVPETTHSSRWPLLSGPPAQPRHWKHCTRSPPTAPVWCPGFPGIHLHSQSPQLQEKVWWSWRKKTPKA